jgi:hypothetical protein
MSGEPSPANAQARLAPSFLPLDIDDLHNTFKNPVELQEFCDTHGLCIITAARIETFELGSPDYP